MRQLALAEAEVDVCDACGGVWIDWFDGELRAIASETLRSSESPSKAKDGESVGSAPRNEVAAAGACPRCSQQLVSEKYVVTTEIASSRIEGRMSIVGGESGADLLRCEACMGAFVSRSSAEVLAWLSSSDDPPPSHGPQSVRPLPWHRLVALLKSFLRLPAS